LPDAGTATSITCTTTCDDSDWTYYEDPNAPGNYLFAIEWDPAGMGNNGPAKAGAQVVIDVDAAFTGVDDGVEKTWSMARYWNVTPGAPLVDPVNVKFFYDAAEKAAIETEMMNDGRPVEGFNWFKTTGVDFDPAVHVTGPAITGSPVVLTDANTGGLMENGVLYAQFDGITSFSGGAGAAGVGEADSPLPVELTYFRAEAKGEQVELTWETASEENNDFFTLEHSTDGLNFEYLGEIDGKGNSNITNDYRFVHPDPTVGVNYYRLSQTDFDGTNKEADVIAVDYKSDKIIATILPNPIRQHEINLNYISPQNSEVEIEVIDMTGKVLIQTTISVSEGENNIQLPAQNWASGVYYLRTIQNQTIKSIKFVKTN